MDICREARVEDTNVDYKAFMVLVQPRKASRSRLSVEEICRTRTAALLTLWLVLLLLLLLLRVDEGL